MHERSRYQPPPHQRRITSEIFSPIPDASHPSQGEAAAADGHAKNENGPENGWYTGIPLVDAAILGAREGIRDADRIMDAVEPVLEGALDRITGMDKIKRDLAEHERQQRMSELREGLARYPQASSKMDPTAS